MKLEPKFRQAPAGAPISATQPAVHNEMAFGQNRQQRIVAQAAWPPIKSTAGEINRIVFLAAAPNLLAEKLKSRSLFIVARDDADGTGSLRLPGIRAQYEKAPQPKQLIVLDGSAHVQFLFQTESAGRVLREILDSLRAQ